MPIHTNKRLALQITIHYLSNRITTKESQSLPIKAMLAVKRSEKTPTCAVNVLPCRIQHNGPVHASTRHWTPEITSDGNQNSTATAYFRGRKLNGRVLDLPEGYRGMYLVLSSLLHLLSCSNSNCTYAMLNLFTRQREKKN